MPADGPHGIRYGGSVIRIRAIVWNVGTCRCNVKGEPRADKTVIGRVPMCSTGAELFVVVMKVL